MAKRPWRKRRAMTPRRLKKQRWEPGWPTCWEWDVETLPILQPHLVASHEEMTRRGFGIEVCSIARYVIPFEAA